MRPPPLLFRKAAFQRPAPISDIWERRKQLDLAPPTSIVTEDGSLIRLKCLTPEEASLVAEELEREDIVVIRSGAKTMDRECRTYGHTEVLVSARAYQNADPALRASVEFQYYIPPEERPLDLASAIIGFWAGSMLIPPGALIFAWLFTSYLKNGDEKKARQFLYWFLGGLAMWVGVVLCCTLF